MRGTSASRAAGVAAVVGVAAAAAAAAADAAAAAAVAAAAAASVVRATRMLLRMLAMLIEPVNESANCFGARHPVLERVTMRRPAAGRGDGKGASATRHGVRARGGDTRKGQ